MSEILQRKFLLRRKIIQEQTNPNLKAAKAKAKQEQKNPFHFNLHTKGETKQEKGDFPAMNLIKKVFAYTEQTKKLRKSVGRGEATRRRMLNGERGKAVC